MASLVFSNELICFIVATDRFLYLQIWKVKVPQQEEANMKHTLSFSLQGSLKLNSIFFLFDCIAEC